MNNKLKLLPFAIAGCIMAGPVAAADENSCDKFRTGQC